ncbi:MAG: hypothetical protein WD740_01075 [Anaerolineales bacterium]
MKHEDWAVYRRQAEQGGWKKFSPLPKTQAQAIAELRAEVDGLAGRVKAELLAELRIEIERLIAMEAPYASHHS